MTLRFSPLTRQPATPARPSAGALFKGMFFLSTPTSGAINVSTGTPMTSTAVSNVVGPHGRAWQFSRASDSRLVLPSAAVPATPAGWTIFALAKASAGASAPFVINKNYDGSTVQFSLYLTSGVFAGAAFFNGAWRSSGIVSNILDDKVHAVVGTCDIAANLLSFYVDGVLDSSAASSGSLSASTGDLYVGRYENNAVSLDGEIYHVGALNRCWSEAEVKAYTRQVWSAFAPLPRRIWAPSAAGGAAAIVARSLHVGQAVNRANTY